MPKNETKREKKDIIQTPGFNQWDKRQYQIVLCMCNSNPRKRKMRQKSTLEEILTKTYSF